MADPRIADQIQENLSAYFRLFAGLPGITFVEGDVTWCASRDGAPGRQVLRTRLAPEDAERRIDETLDQAGDEIDWLIFPSCRPADLGRRLEARGMPGGPGGIWMLADTADLHEAPPPPDHLRVEQVRDDAALALWTRLSSAGFEVDVQRNMYDAYARHGYGPQAISHHYIAYHGDTPVTTSTLLIAGGIAGVFDISTPPEHRRRGYGGAITRAMLHEARARGQRTVWNWASAMGQSVYQRVGFTTVDLGIREHRWRRPAAM